MFIMIENRRRQNIRILFFNKCSCFTFGGRQGNLFIYKLKIPRIPAMSKEDVRQMY